MAATIKRLKNSQGFVLLASLLVMSILLLLAVYVINFTLTEFKIATSQATATQAYYLAESGVAEAIWKLKNDPTWKSGFETNANWSITYTRSSALYDNGSYTISITNTAAATGDITVTGIINLPGGNLAQRIIKIGAYKATGGTSPVGDNAAFGNGNINISGAILHIYNGSVQANGNVVVNYWSVLNVSHNVKATGNIIVNNNSSISAETRQAGASEVAMPSISFDDVSDPNSYINRADKIYTQSEFDNLMWNNPILSLSGITYVNGNIDIKANQNLTINGLLVASGNITIGKNTLFCYWGLRHGTSIVTVNKKAIGQPSGIIAKGKINFELCLNDFQVNGIVYANDVINVLSLPGNFSVIGGIVSRKYTMTSVWRGASVTLNQDNLINVLGGAEFSPVVTVNHWEEEY